MPIDTRGIFKFVIGSSFNFMSSMPALWEQFTQPRGLDLCPSLGADPDRGKGPLSTIEIQHNRVSGRRLYRTLGTRGFIFSYRDWSPHLQTANRLTLQHCHLYICLPCNSSLFHFLFFIVSTNCRWSWGTPEWMKYKSALCLIDIYQHYVWFHRRTHWGDNMSFPTLFSY